MNYSRELASGEMCLIKQPRTRRSHRRSMRIASANDDTLRRLCTTIPTIDERSFYRMNP